MRHVGTKVAANNCMPSWVVLLVKLLLDEGGNVFLNVYFSRACVAQSIASCC